MFAPQYLLRLIYLIIFGYFVDLLKYLCIIWITYFYQIHKQRPLQDFISDDQSVLVCTDIASRGIDCSKVCHQWCHHLWCHVCHTQINHVIQYDFPTSVTDYLHRVGRTGRVGGVTQCLATTLMTKKKDVRVALKIEVQKPLQIFIKSSQCM